MRRKEKKKQKRGMEVKPEAERVEHEEGEWRSEAPDQIRLHMHGVCVCVILR